jgi:hypothetical protein
MVFIFEASTAELEKNRLIKAGYGDCFAGPRSHANCQSACRNGNGRQAYSAAVTAAGCASPTVMALRKHPACTGEMTGVTAQQLEYDQPSFESSKAFKHDLTNGCSTFELRMRPS